jgi:putative ABC transport system permease protein
MLWLRLFRESLVLAWSAIVLNKLRTFLSLLGVMVGIFVISAVFAVVDSMEDGLMESFSMMDDDVMFIQKWPWEFGEDYPWWKYVQRREPTFKDSRELESRLTLAEAVSFQMKALFDIEAGSSLSRNVSIVAASHKYHQTINMDLGSGRLFSESESASGWPVAIIGHTTAMDLFGKSDVLGEKIKVKGYKLEIVGVFKKQGASMIAEGFDNSAVIPARFANKLFDVHHMDGNAIIVKAKDGVELDVLKDEIIQHFRSVRRIRPADSDDFSINHIEMLTGMISTIFSQVEKGGWFIAIFAILVGCFSIANIMFVSVRERTKLIGIQKALGAKSTFIMIQFLFESVALCIFGAALALLAINILILVINLADIGIQLGVSFSRVMMAMSIAVVSGLIAGIAPAMKAANMEPVEAIRST